MENNRLINPDFIKAISILGVVFLHSPEILTSSNPIKLHLQEIFRFCVPCFIILWAYFFEKSYSNASHFKEKFSYSKKRFISLFKIYFIYSTLYFLISVNWDTITITKMITMYYLGHGFTGQYFFIVIFQLIVLYPLLRYLYSKRSLLIITTIIISSVYMYYTFYFDSLPIVLSKLSDTLFIFWLPYVFVGVGLARNELIKIPIVYILSIFLVPVEWYILRNYSLAHSGYVTPVVLMSSILFCVALMQTKLKITNRFLRKIIDFFGQNSILFFVINPLVALLISSNFRLLNLLGDGLVISLFDPILSFLFVLVICSLATYLIKITKLRGLLY